MSAMLVIWHLFAKISLCTNALGFFFQLQGRNNMFQALLLFLHHIDTKEHGMLG